MLGTVGVTRRLGIPDQTGGRSGKPDGTLQCSEWVLARPLLFRAGALGAAGGLTDVWAGFRFR